MEQTLFLWTSVSCFTSLSLLFLLSKMGVSMVLPFIITWFNHSIKWDNVDHIPQYLAPSIWLICHTYLLLLLFQSFLWWAILMDSVISDELGSIAKKLWNNLLMLCVNFMETTVQLNDLLEFYLYWFTFSPEIKKVFNSKEVNKFPF